MLSLQTIAEMRHVSQNRRDGGLCNSVFAKVKSLKFGSRSILNAFLSIICSKISNFAAIKEHKGHWNERIDDTGYRDNRSQG